MSVAETVAVRELSSLTDFVAAVNVADGVADCESSAVNEAEIVAVTGRLSVQVAVRVAVTSELSDVDNVCEPLSDRDSDSDGVLVTGFVGVPWSLAVGVPPVREGVRPDLDGEAVLPESVGVMRLGEALDECVDETESDGD